MKFDVVRALAYAAVVVVVVFALQFVLRPHNRRSAESSVPLAAAPSWKRRIDTLARGENLRAVLRRDGLSDTAATRAANAAAMLDQGHVPAGMPVTVSTLPDSAPSDIALQIAVDRVVHLTRTGVNWAAREDTLPWKTDTIVVSGPIQSNLYAAMDQTAKDFLPAAARERLTELLADVFEYRLDMSRDLNPGDQFKVIAERSATSTGAVRIGNVLAATFVLSGSVFDAIRFTSAKVPSEFFDQEGKAMRAAFLHAPLQFRRISSGFGMRLHPILGDERMHEGMDYAADAGTPVRAIGDGVVIRAGWGNGYGNMIEIRHNNGYVTRYGHMRNFAAGIHTGVHVHIGETIGYVGSTGLSTGPHLHFEVIVNGVQRDPRTALSRTGGDPIPETEKAAFTAIRDRMLALLDASATGATTLVAQR